MRIKIALKLRPFSHRPGTCCLIPFSTWEVAIFPAKLFFTGSLSGEKEEISLPIEGPVSGFTILQDLEKGRIEVFGKGVKGYFRYFLTPDGVVFSKGGARKISLPFIQREEVLPVSKRLSLGVHKKQDWDLIQRRCDLAEIFPFWVRLSQLVPKAPFSKKGTGRLIEKGELELAFKAAFQGILCPRLKDENHLGILPEEEVSRACPLGLLHQGAKEIESLFFFEEKQAWHFLPHLPKALHAGRFVCLTTTLDDRIDIEWSKKELKKVIIHPAKDRRISLKLQSRLKTFRLRTNPRQKGERCKRDAPLQLYRNRTLYLDRFTH